MSEKGDPAVTELPMPREVASLLVRLVHRLEQVSPGLPYEAHDAYDDRLVDTDHLVLQHAIVTLLANQYVTAWEREALTAIAGDTGQ